MTAAPDQDLIWREKVPAVAPPPVGCGCTFTYPIGNAGMPALATVGDAALASAFPLQLTPATRYVFVFINGVQTELGDLTAPCYFSGDGGATARTLGTGGTLVSGDLLYWNGSIAGWDLSASDRITYAFFEAS